MTVLQEAAIALKSGKLTQDLSQSAELEWHCFDKLDKAQKWLKNHAPDLLILSLDRNNQWEKSLALMTDLATRTPSIPAIANINRACLVWD